MLTMSITPKMSVRPAAINAYTPPVSTPSTTACARSVSDTRSRPYVTPPDGDSRAPVRLRDDRRLVAGRPDRDRRHQRRVLPLERRRTERGVLAERVELDRSLHAVEGHATVKVGDDLR